MIKPMRDLLLITINKQKEKKTKSGILLAEKWESSERSAKVEAVGPQVTDFLVGEQVVINPYAVIEAGVGEEKLCFIKQADILAKQ